MENRDDWLSVAGVFVDPLLIEVSDLTEQLHLSTAPASVAYGLSDAIEVMHQSAGYWLDSNGSYRDDAAATCSAVHKAFESVFQEVEFSHVDALAATVRTFAGVGDELPGSAVVAAWAIALAGEAIAALYDGQLKQQRASIQLTESATTAGQSARALAAEQDMAEARVIHAEYVGMARLALLLSGLHYQFEHMPGNANGYRIESLLRAAVKAPSVARARAGGMGNKAPGTAKQKGAAWLRGRIGDAAGRHIRGSPSGVTLKELVNVLLEQRLASRPTLVKYLKELGYK